MLHSHLEELDTLDHQHRSFNQLWTHVTRLTIDRGACSRNLRRSVPCFQILPYSPYAVNLCMVEEESWIASAGIWIVSGVALNGEVSASMHTVDGLEIRVETIYVGAAGYDACDVCWLRLVTPDEGHVPL